MKRSLIIVSFVCAGLFVIHPNGLAQDWIRDLNSIDFARPTGLLLLVYPGDNAMIGWTEEEREKISKMTFAEYEKNPIEYHKLYWTWTTSKGDHHTWTIGISPFYPIPLITYHDAGWGRGITIKGLDCTNEYKHEFSCELVFNKNKLFSVNPCTEDYYHDRICTYSDAVECEMYIYDTFTDIEKSNVRGILKMKCPTKMISEVDPMGSEPRQQQHGR